MVETSNWTPLPVKEGCKLTQDPNGAGRAKASILVVDDMPGIRELLHEVLTGEHWEVKLASTALEALEEVSTNSPGLAIIDVKMPGMNGLDLVREMRNRGFEGEVVMVSGYSDEDIREEARKQGIRHWVVKPFDLNDLHQLVARVMQEMEKGGLPHPQ